MTDSTSFTANAPAKALPSQNFRVAVIGGGPAGLMAAEVLANAGAAVSVQVYDAMPSVGRKFLLAGKGGLNLTHAEPAEPFLTRYGERRAQIEPLLTAFGAPELRAWAQALGIDTFVGSTGRVFPKDMKAAPLLRAWLHRLRSSRVQFFMRHRWLGWADDGALKFSSPTGDALVTADAVVLALGGGSWARLGSDGAWVPLLEAHGLKVVPLQPSNCGFDVATTQRGGAAQARQPGWTEYFSSRFAGQAFKSVGLSLTGSQGRSFKRVGEFVATATGVEGSLIYAASSLLRQEIEHTGSATVQLDLLPHKSLQEVLLEVRHPRGSRSLSSHLKSRLKLDGVKAAIVHEILGKEAVNDPVKLAHAIKALPLTLAAARPIDEAISSAGGVPFEALTATLQVQLAQLRPEAQHKSSSSPAGLQAVFCAGEMLDWEAPTGGYLLTACFASGHAAGYGVLRHLGLHGN